MFSPLPSSSVLVLPLALAATLAAGDATAAALPDPQVNVPIAAPGAMQTAVFAGGCFWGVEAVFRHVDGVTQAVSGYAGGEEQKPSYRQVSTGATGHAEAVRVSFDPARVSYGQLLKVFFSVAHDPTQMNRQGPDVGTQYRSAIFVTNEGQRQMADAYVAQLQTAHAFSRPIVTQIAPLSAFYEAEAYHQNYLALHPEQPYVVANDLPKLSELRLQFPDLYR